MGPDHGQAQQGKVFVDYENDVFYACFNFMHRFLHFLSNDVHI